MALSDNILKWKNVRGTVNELILEMIETQGRVSKNEKDISALEGFEVEDIKALSNAQIAGLKPSSAVIKKTGDERHTYRVAYLKPNKELALVYVDAWSVEEVYYEKGVNDWAWIETRIISIPELATKGYVDGKVAAALAEAKSYADGKVVGLATTNYVDGKVAGLATETYVQNAISTAIIGAINDEY